MIGDGNIVDVPALEGDISDLVDHPELTVQVQEEERCWGNIGTGGVLTEQQIRVNVDLYLTGGRWGLTLFNIDDLCKLYGRGTLWVYACVEDDSHAEIVTDLSDLFDYESQLEVALPWG